MFGVDAFSAIITPPQAAVLAVGRIADRVVPVNGLIGIRPILTMTLSSDHRVVDGAQAAAFLKGRRRSAHQRAAIVSGSSLRSLLEPARAFRSLCRVGNARSG